MFNKTIKKMLSMFLSVMLVSSVCLPSMALAQETVRMNSQGGSLDAERQVSKILIDDVSAPQPGVALDDTAKVTTAEGESWDIPVMWVGSNMELATTAEEGLTYLPALAFYVPDGYAVAGSENGYTVQLSDSLTKLFGGQEIISVYDASTRITYIIPASLREFFARGGSNEEEQAREDVVDEEEPVEVASDNANPEPAKPTPKEDEEQGQEEQKQDQENQKPVSLVDIYCSQTAKNELSTSDLEWVIDLIINKLQPQAVNLLLEKFPAFKQGFEEGKIGREIGLYIYYENGDKDGDPYHESASEALAYVAGTHYVANGTVHYGYMLAVDVESITKEDANGNLVIIKDGKDFETFQNTLVHEMFHAFMDDFNRPGMSGTTDIAHAVTDTTFRDEEQKANYSNTRYPSWFVEGTASAVENVFMYRHSLFERLMGASNNFNAYTPEALIQNYITAIPHDKLAYYMIETSGREVSADGKPMDATASRYVGGYLAVLYLGELATRQAGDSSISQTGGVTTISSDKIRMGLNSILERMNLGETLDQVINSISPTDGNGNKYYANTSEFEKQFLMEGRTENSVDILAAAAGPSAQFVSAFLNYMHAIEQDPSRTYLPNGSILFGFDEDFATPLDPNKNDSSDAYKIVQSNTITESTVPDSTALKGGGKSASGTPSHATQSEPESEPAAQETTEAQAAEQSDAQSESQTETPTPSDPVADPQPEATEQPEEETPASPEAPVVSGAPESEPAPAEEPGSADQQLPEAA